MVNSSNGNGNNGKRIPKVLEERLLIGDKERQILEVMQDLSPKDTGNIYTPRNVEKDIPSFKDIAERAGIDEKDVRKYVDHVKAVWRIPDKLPRGEYGVTEDQALINAVVNQHKLRWDPEIRDYRIPRIHEYQGEMGLGMLFTNNKAFEGQRIFRNATGLNEMLNSVHFQGGLLPTIPAFYSKNKNQRALLVGLNKTGKIPSEKEVEEVRSTLELSKNAPLDAKQTRNLQNFVVNTIDSLEEAAKSSAHEFVTLVKNLPSHVPIHLYLSYADDFNMSEQEDLFITSVRETLSKASEAHVHLPTLYDDKSFYQNEVSYNYINMKVVDFLIGNLKGNKAYKSVTKSGDKKPLHSTLTDMLSGRGQTDREIGKLKTELFEQYTLDKGREERADFERVFNEAMHRYTSRNSSFKTLSSMEKSLERYRKLKDDAAISLNDTNDKIAELEQYKNARLAERQEGHAWLTKKYAIRPTDSKAMYMLLKQFYKDLYENSFIPEVKRLAGKDLNILLHMDREISVFVEDPATLLKKNDYSDDKLYGTIITSIPRVNRQKSNEPLGDNFAVLQKKHEGAISHMIKEGLEKPKTRKEFSKRQSSAFSDVIFTSWGLDGYRLQPKLLVDITTADGEYMIKTDTTWYLSLPPRYDMQVLGDLMKRGNKGTFEGKRLDGAGSTTGNVLHIMHPNMAPEWVFVEDSFYERIVDKYGDSIKDLESKISRAKTADSRKALEKKLHNLYASMKPEMYHILLENDTHHGVANRPGTPTNIDVVNASLQAVLQTYGIDGLEMMTGTEIPNGNLSLGKFYKTSELGYNDDPLTIAKNLELLEKGLLDKGKTRAEINKYKQAYTMEQFYGMSIFRPEQQKDMVVESLYTPIKELMDNDTQVILGSGNHYKMSHMEDEAKGLAQLFDPKYRDTGTLKTVPANGEGFSLSPIKIPAADGKTLDAMLTHQMDSGKTEISKASAQAVGNRQRALIYFTADRHQPGIAVERDKVIVLDAGKQGPGQYPMQIGKASSVRGTIVFGYASDGEPIYSTRFFLDDVVEKVIDWPEKASMLKECHDIIKEGLKATYKKE